jgi:hypothetical protein
MVFARSSKCEFTAMRLLRGRRIARESGYSRGFENFKQCYALPCLKKFVTGFPDSTHFPARAQLGDHLVEERKLEFPGFLCGFCT